MPRIIGSAANRKNKPRIMTYLPSFRRDFSKFIRVVSERSGSMFSGKSATIFAPQSPHPPVSRAMARKLSLLKSPLHTGQRIGRALVLLKELTKSHTENTSSTKAIPRLMNGSDGDASTSVAKRVVNVIIVMPIAGIMKKNSRKEAIPFPP